MEIKTQHKPGDFVWFLSNRTKLINRVEILGIYAYQFGELTWKINIKDKKISDGGKLPSYLETDVVKDSECFKTKKELVDYITDPSVENEKDFHFTADELKELKAGNDLGASYTSSCLYISPDIYKANPERVWSWSLLISDDEIKSVIGKDNYECMWTLDEVHKLEDIHAQLNTSENTKDGLQEYMQKVLNRFYGLDCKKLV